MSNILIIKHGAFGDIIQALGIMQDIAEHHGGKIDILTHKTFAPLFQPLPWINHIIIDDRKTKNLNHFRKLFKTLHKAEYTCVYDLQNSTRTTVYRWLFFRHLPFISNRSMLQLNETKKALDKKCIYDSFDLMLERSGIQPKHCRQSNIDTLKDINFKTHSTLKPYVFIAPFCSANSPYKKWASFKSLIAKLQVDFPTMTFVCAPGPGETDEANQYGVKTLLDHGNPTTLNQLISIILDSSYVITLDTAAAHIAAKANKPGTLIMNPQLFDRIFLKEQNLSLACKQTKLHELPLDKVYTKIKQDLTRLLVKEPDFQI
ncbi:MAG: glycosyltransferase family 9 protein [Pseudomonadota bacterium]|nr:glycosyltransferase family 9 protein [Pseudomonadota bacterium]